MSYIQTALFTEKAKMSYIQTALFTEKTNSDVQISSCLDFGENICRGFYVGGKEQTIPRHHNHDTSRAFPSPPPSPPPPKAHWRRVREKRSQYIKFASSDRLVKRNNATMWLCRDLVSSDKDTGDEKMVPGYPTGGGVSGFRFVASKLAVSNCPCGYRVLSSRLHVVPGVQRVHVILKRDC